MRTLKPLLLAVVVLAAFSTSGCGYIAHAIVHDAAHHAGHDEHDGHHDDHGHHRHKHHRHR